MKRFWCIKLSVQLQNVCEMCYFLKKMDYRNIFVWLIRKIKNIMTICHDQTMKRMYGEETLWYIQYQYDNESKAS